MAHQLQLPERPASGHAHARDGHRRWHLPHIEGLSDSERQRSIARLAHMTPGDGLRITTADASISATLIGTTPDGKLVGQLPSGQIVVLDIARASLSIV